MFNILKLKGKIVENGMTLESFSKAINMDKATFCRRLKQPEKFTIGEACRTVEVLHLTTQDALDIFFAQESQNCDKAKEA